MKIKCFYYVSDYELYKLRNEKTTYNNSVSKWKSEKHQMLMYFLLELDVCVIYSV